MHDEVNEDIVIKFYELFRPLQERFGLTLASHHDCTECMMRVYWGARELFCIRMEPEHMLNFLDPDDLQRSEELRVTTYERAYKQLHSWAEKMHAV